MAVSFIQTPTTPNGSQSNIIYSLSGLTTASQAKYICDVKYSGSSDTLVRIKQPANNSNFGVFEISEILHDYTDYDEPWTTTSIVNSTNNNVKDFSIEFGEEYGSSPSSSLTIVPSQITSSLTIYPAVTELDEGFNWDYTTYRTQYLTNSPSCYVRTSDYGTLSHTNLSGYAPQTVTYIFYNSSNQAIATQTVANSYGTTNTVDKLIHIPAGPQNIKGISGLGLVTGSTWSYYDVILDNSLGTKRFYRLDDCVEENGTQFAFVNKLGVFDYYTAPLTKTEQEQYNTETYEQSFIDFSTTDGSVTFDKSRRGTTVYNKKIDATFSAQTDWLTTEQVDWLIELFQSPSVYIRQGVGFIPVIITNSVADKKTNPRGQKLFTYRIEYKLANPRRARR